MCKLLHDRIQIFKYIVKVIIEPSHDIVEPGRQVKLKITAQPHSDVALLAVDAGLYVLNNKNKLTRRQVRSSINWRLTQVVL